MGGTSGALRPAGFEGILAFAGSEPVAAAEANFVAFRRFALLLIAVEAWEALRYAPYQAEPVLHAGLACGLALCAAAAWHSRSARAAGFAAAALVSIQLAAVFPENANHQYLALFCLVLLGLPASDSAEERAIALQGLRCLLLVGLGWAGLQKILHGYYFGGEFLAHRIAVDPDFAAPFRYLVPGEELARLQALPSERGAGPFRVASPLFVAASNAVYLAELALPVLLVARRTRRVGVVATLAFLLAIESGAREFYFGLWMVALTLLFWPGAAVRRLLPALLLGCGVLLLGTLAALRGGANGGP